ncbi:MAG: NUDIX domain-containing protein [Paramuribaculum sp.]|nr:NUDIX domain-containing protein [Paramuribaculum sp.]MDE7449573.1 NUDIX domain-containing protein [Paramuribaculum sp.]
MKFTYCPDCGTLLESRILGDEGAVPWCSRCNKPWFPMFSTCIIALVHDRQGRVLLLRQNYIHPVYRNLVSGYMTPGETAEETARREIKEETGLEVTDLKLIGTWWFARKDMLMIGFFAEVDGNTPLSLSSEVDGASWHTPAEALTLVHPEGSVSHALVKSFCEI